MSKLGTNVREAAKILTEGGLVAIPTETVYGLAANAFNEAAITKVFQVKNRPSFDPLITQVANKNELNNLAKNIPPDAQKLMDVFWPGPLTIVLPKTERISDLITSGLPSAAFRVPNHPIALKLLRALDFPLVAPSANPFTYVSPTTAQHVEQQLGEKVDYILDGGPCQVGLESTIISFTGNLPKVLRLGGLSIEEIEKEIGSVSVQTHSSSRPEAPGMLINHYSPGIPLVIGEIDKLLKENKGKKVGIISYKKAFPDYINTVLAPSENMAEAAKNLFKALRWMDDQKVEIIVTEWVPNEGLGRAINDRLKRAASN